MRGGPSGLERWTGDRVVLGSNPAGGTSFWNFANFPFTLRCLSEEIILKVVDPFHLQLPRE